MSIQSQDSSVDIYLKNDHKPYRRRGALDLDMSDDVIMSYYDVITGSLWIMSSKKQKYKSYKMS